MEPSLNPSGKSLYCFFSCTKNTLHTEVPVKSLHSLCEYLWNACHGLGTGDTAVKMIPALMELTCQ